ncbi:MAG: type II toxin-antitoxin system ParD family antitoxin [Promethearchaeia archaeon]
MKLISLNLPESYLNILETLVTQSRFPNRSEAIRVAIRDLIKTEYMIDETLKEKYNSDGTDKVETAISGKIEDELLV